nr:glycosyltransferase [Longimicrobium terrae]
MAVYNDLATDGRVQRAARALAGDFDVRVAYPAASGAAYRAEGYEAAAIPVRGAGPVRLARFSAAVLALARRTRPAVVYAHDYYLSAVGALAARLAGAALVYDAHELIVPEPDIPVDRRDRFFYRMEKRSIHRAGLVIVANRARGEVMRSHYGLADEPLVVRNIPEAPHPVSAIHRSDAGGVRLVYQGYMDEGRGIGVFIDALALLPPEFRLEFIGGGPGLAALRARAERMGVGGRMEFAGPIPRDALDARVRACHIGLIAYVAPDRNNRLCAPNKLYEYAQAGVPVVALGSPYLAGMVREGGVGTALATEDVSPERVAAAIRELAGSLPGYAGRLQTFVAAHPWSAEAEPLRRAVAALVTAS